MAMKQSLLQNLQSNYPSLVLLSPREGVLESPQLGHGVLAGACGLREVMAGRRLLAAEVVVVVLLQLVLVVRGREVLLARVPHGVLRSGLPVVWE